MNRVLTIYSVHYILQVKLVDLAFYGSCISVERHEDMKMLCNLWFIKEITKMLYLLTSELRRTFPKGKVPRKRSSLLHKLFDC